MEHYKSDTSASFSEISEIESEYTEWYNLVLRSLVFPDEVDTNSIPLRKTEKLRKWMENSHGQELMVEGVYDNLNALYQDFHQLIERLLYKAQENKTKLTRKEFDELTAFFEEFMTHLRRVEQDSSLKDNGIDMLTGLRHRSVMHEDLEKEMERLARRGRPFCVALARIDQYEDMRKILDRSASLRYTKLVADFIKRCIRSFDDAYRIDDGLFLLILKQTDITGGLAAIKRLRKLMESNEVTVDLGVDQKPLLSLSCCIAEPVEGDSPDMLLQNLKDDLDNIEGDDGGVLEYVEMSPLQRYMKSET